MIFNMNIPIPLEECYRADEIIRVKKMIKLDQQRQFFKSIIHYREEFQLFDYERPLKSITKKNKKYSFIKWLKSFLP